MTTDIATPAESAKPTEGWQGEKRYDQRKYHYIRDTESLCRSLAFYHGEIVPGGLTPSDSAEDCAQCKRLVKAEIAKREGGK